jgi:SAM-dependent methyltransferase
MGKSEQALRAAFGEASPDHFAWQTAAPGVAERERELVQSVFLPLGERVLDLGCGEGATLFHLGEPAGAVGVDLFEAKVRFARARLPNCRFEQASVYELPFEDKSFDHLVVRDLVHHLESPERFVAECARVCAPGGRIDVLEPSRYNPLIVAHALLNPVERGELRSTLPFLRRILSPHFAPTEARTLQPLPVHRLVYHPELGRPQLANNPVARALVDATERLAESVMPSSTWAYLHLRASRRS